MSKKNYHLRLKGYVGGWDFDRNEVDSVLDKYANSPVSVLIDSTGGSLATGLSISSAFKAHGDVSVHFVGLNASAATIASLGAKHISIDAGAMYLVHQCSTYFFEWGSLNSDQFAALIADCQKIKADLDKFDQNVAQLYAARCKRKPEDLLALMKVGGWISAKEALEWGFVDEITDLPEEKAPQLTDALASAMAAAGMPLPNIPVDEADKTSAFAKFLEALTSFFKPSVSNINSIAKVMKKTYSRICALLSVDGFELSENKAAISDEQLTKIEDHIEKLNGMIDEKYSRIKALEEEVAALKKQPAEDSKKVVDSPKKEPAAMNEIEQYIECGKSAARLFNSLP